MFDTSPEIQQKQLEIIFAKTPQERFLIGAEILILEEQWLKAALNNKILEFANLI
ncbi:MAG: hypothetical protein H8D45_17585 [Bacteroidetes bacterium]|nr:hypothetical protein [Bacteroidota bacterium]MBL7103001.1 hypothetical protein [Bacteroidales bacterium]